MLLWIFRALISVLLGLTVFCALLILLFSHALNNLLQDEIYSRALSEQKAYTRIYSEALTSRAIDDFRQSYPEEPAILFSGEVMDLIIEIAPPDYLKGQTEDNLGRISDYFSGEDQRLQLYLELGEPLDRLAPALARTVQNLLDQATLPPIDTGTPAFTALEETGHAEDVAHALESLLAGKSPSTTVSELTGLSESELLSVFDRAVDQVLESPAVDRRYQEALRESRVELRQAFTSGDTRHFLERAIHSVVQIAVDSALEEFGAGLDDQERLDLVPLLSEYVAGESEEEFRSVLEEWKNRINQTVFWSRLLALAVIVVAAGIIALVLWRRHTSTLLWAQLTLTLSGIVTLGVVLVASWQLPAIAKISTYALISESTSWTPGAAALASDVLGSITADLLQKLIWPAALPLLAGLVIVALQFGWRRWFSQVDSQ